MAMRLFETVLNTGAGSSSIALDEVPQWLRDKIEPLRDDVTVRKAIGKPVSLLGIIVLTVQLGNGVEKVLFFVAKKTRHHRHFVLRVLRLTLRLHNMSLKIVRIDDEPRVEIIRQLFPTTTKFPFLEEQQFEKRPCITKDDEDGTCQVANGLPNISWGIYGEVWKDYGRVISTPSVITFYASPERG